MYLLTCAPNIDSNQPLHLSSLNSLCCSHEETLHSLAIQNASSEDSDQTMQTFAGDTCTLLKVHFLTLWLILGKAGTINRIID